MNKSYHILLTILCCLLSNAVWAEDDVLSLLKELKALVKELRTQVEQSNKRIDELENERQQYHAEQQTVGKQNKEGMPSQVKSPNVPAVAENTAGKANDKLMVKKVSLKSQAPIPQMSTLIMFLPSMY